MNGSNRHAVLASTVFDGTALHQECAVVIEGSCICGIAARRELPAAMPIRTLAEGAWLAPGFIDVQVNGGGDVLFNDEPTPEGVGAIVAAHRQFGTTALVPTLISDTPAKMRATLDAVRRTTPARPYGRRRCRSPALGQCACHGRSFLQMAAIRSSMKHRVAPCAA